MKDKIIEILCNHACTKDEQLHCDIGCIGLDKAVKAIRDECRMAVLKAVPTVDEILKIVDYWNKDGACNIDASHEICLLFEDKFKEKK